MGGINLGKVVIGGLVAGLIMNIGEFILNELLLGERWSAAAAAISINPPEGPVIVFFTILTFILGIAIVGLYAGFRPRCGPGPKTAICAGVTAWFFNSLMGFGLPTGIMGIFPTDLILISMVWTFVEYSVAALAGAYLYSE